MFDLNNVTRKNVRLLTPYSSARDEFSGKDAVYFDANENPYDTGYNRYPDPYQRELKKKVGEVKHINPKNIFLGNGSDEAIDLLIRAFCEPRTDNIITMPPTYGMYKVAADINDVLVHEVLLKKENDKFTIDVEAVKKESGENTKLIFICSPNNPTANSLALTEIENLLKFGEETSCIIIVDEAYIDFSSQKSLTLLLDKYKNLVVLQTFSKAWGLAGIRLGMAFASNEIISILSKIKAPYNVNQLTQQFAKEKLENTSHKDETLKKIMQERDFLIKEFEKITLIKKIYPTDANFILVEVEKPTETYNFLITKGVVVRDRSKILLCEGCLRITVGTKEENRILIKELKTKSEELRTKK